MSPHSQRAIAAGIAEIDRRVRALEKHFERQSGLAARGSASLARAADSAGEAIAAALTDVAERFRNGTRFIGSDAARFGNDVVKLSNDVGRRLSDAVEHRPLMMLAVVGGLGFLAGMVGRRR